MAKAISLFLTAGTAVGMFWFHAAPNGEEICASSVPFATMLDTDVQREAAGVAKTKFCAVVDAYPM